MDSFELDIGNPHHPSSKGSWKLRLDQNGSLTISYALAREKRKFGPFKLSEEETKPLWQSIYAIDFSPRTLRPGIPDESMLTIMLWQDGVLNSSKIWLKDISKNAAINYIVLECVKLIESFTQENVAL